MNPDKLAKELDSVPRFPHTPLQIFESLKNLLPMVAVELLITRPDRSFVLIEKVGTSGAWALPGGYIGFNESPEDACRRIAKRDLGMVLSSIIFFKIFNWPEGSLRSTYGHALSLLFQCKAKKNIKHGKYFKKIPAKVLPHHAIMLNEALLAQ